MPDDPTILGAVKKWLEHHPRAERYDPVGAAVMRNVATRLDANGQNTNAARLYKTLSKTQRRMLEQPGDPTRALSELSWYARVTLGMLLTMHPQDKCLDAQEAHEWMQISPEDLSRAVNELQEAGFAVYHDQGAGGAGWRLYDPEVPPRPAW